MTPQYTITAARPQDVTQLAAIELAAARLLVGFAPESVLTETTSLDVLERAQREERLCVALDGDVPVGFAYLDVIEPGAIHLEEIDVHPNHGCLGTKLICHVCDWATGKGYDAVTLTTFRDVAWNLPFYSRLGFSVVPTEQVSASLRAIVEDETCRGLDPSRRVVMRRASSWSR